MSDFSTLGGRPDRRTKDGKDHAYGPPVETARTPDGEVKKVAIPQGEETFILCRTTGRKEKEKAIRNRLSNRMEDALKRLDRGGWAETGPGLA